MKRYQRYLYISSLRAFVTVLLSVILLEFLLTFISEVTYDAEENYGFQQAFVYLGLTQFSRIYDLTGAIFLVAFLVALGGLANRSELTVLQATGVTKQAIVAHSSVPFLALALVFFLVAENIAPQLDARANQLKSDWTGEQVAGGWYREQDYLVYAENIANDDLQGVLLLKFEGQRLLEKITADSASHNGEFWSLNQVERVLLNTTPLSVEQLNQWQSPIVASPNILNGVMRDPNGLKIAELAAYQAILAEQGIDTVRLSLNLWQRIAQPLLAVVLLLVAAGVVFGSSRQTSMSKRIIIGVVIGLAIRVTQDLLNAATLAYQLSAPIMALAPIVLLLCSGLWFLARRQ